MQVQGLSKRLKALYGAGGSLWGWGLSMGLRALYGAEGSLWG